MIKLLLQTIVLFCTTLVTAQITVKGKVFDIYLEKLSTINVTSLPEKTTTDIDGNFTLKVNKKLPFSILITAVGYQTQTVQINKENQKNNIILKVKSKLQEVVLSASRTPEKILESPVTIERIGAKDIKNSTSLNFYDNLENLKDVDIHTIGFNVKIINTRGFASLENARFVQLVDGADTASPSSNFSFGNVAGLNELDVMNVEILPGAASALYGANAFNGILSMRSKNPFEYGGISAYAKSGISEQYQNTGGINTFYDNGVRMAYAFNDNFAAKVNFSQIIAEEWNAIDARNIDLDGNIGVGNRANTTAYNGVNVYGDESNVDLKSILLFLEQGGVITPGITSKVPNSRVSRTGVNNNNLVNNDAKSVFFDGSLYFRPTGKKNLEFIWNSKYSYGDNTLQGDTRYVQKGALFQQHKLELKSKYVTARGYYVNFNQGDKSFNTVLLAEGINNSYSIDDIWYQDYGAVYGNTFETAILTNNVEQANIIAHEQARIYAERHKTGTIDDISNKLKNKNISDGGAKTTDNSSYINGDIDLNLTDVVQFADIQMGATYRQHKLNSRGQLFTDLNTPIIYDSYGAYTQVIKKLIDDRLRLTGSIRYDKSTNFKGNYSPRFSVTYAAGVNKNHHFRGSYQTAFRNPTSADQYADQNLGSRIFEVGNVSENLERYVSRTIALRPGSPGIPVVGTSVSLTGAEIVENSYTLNSQQSFSNAVIESIDNNISPLLAIQSNIGLLEKATINPLRTEKVKTFETGYRSSFDLFGSLFEVDVNGYYSIVEDFIVTQIVSTPLFGDINQGNIDLLAPFAIGRYDYAQFAFRVNSPQNHDYYGGGISLSTAVLNGLNIGVNYTYNKFKEHQKGGDINETGNFFNTPAHKFRASLGKEAIFKNIGFNINARWQDSFLWSSNAVSTVIASRTVLDAQINLRVPGIKSTFKLGGTNLFGRSYLTAPGIGQVGSVYYISWKIND